MESLWNNGWEEGQMPVSLSLRRSAVPCSIFDIPLPNHNEALVP